MCYQERKVSWAPPFAAPRSSPPPQHTRSFCLEQGTGPRNVTIQIVRVSADRYGLTFEQGQAMPDRVSTLSSFWALTRTPLGNGCHRELRGFVECQQGPKDELFECEAAKNQREGTWPGSQGSQMRT